jgi:hypothetical protein
MIDKHTRTMAEDGRVNKIIDWNGSHGDNSLKSIIATRYNYAKGLDGLYPRCSIFHSPRCIMPKLHPLRTV